MIFYRALCDILTSGVICLNLFAIKNKRNLICQNKNF